MKLSHIRTAIKGPQEGRLSSGLDFLSTWMFGSHGLFISGHTRYKHLSRAIPSQRVSCDRSCSDFVCRFDWRTSVMFISAAFHCICFQVEIGILTNLLCMYVLFQTLCSHGQLIKLINEQQTRRRKAEKQPFSFLLFLPWNPGECSGGRYK